MIKYADFHGMRAEGFAFACSIVLMAVLLVGPPARAVPVDLYQAAVPVTEHSDAGLTSAFQNAMRVVLVRVTGRRSAANDAALAPLIQNARRYMQEYRAASGNQISVSFDSAAIERWLTQNGQPLWGRERPVTVVWLAVERTQGQRAAAGTVLTREDTSDLKRSLDLAATARGIELRWPSDEEAQSSGVSYATIAEGADTGFAELSRRLGGEGTLVGRANDAMATAGIRWDFIFQGHSSEFSGNLEGINHAADIYASIYATSGGAGPVEFDVAGLGDLRAYANVETYLQSLTSISHLNIVAFQGDTAHFRAMARGGADALRRAVTLDGRLEALADDGSGGMQFRLKH